MRNFINYLLTIVLFITIIITITILSINSLTSKNNTRKILNNINYKKVITEFKETDYGKELYNYANNYGVSEDKVDSILETDEAKNYANEVLQQGLDAYLNSSSIEINDETKEFLDKANKKYELNLNDDQISELEGYANSVINDNLNVVVNNDTNNQDDTNAITQGQFLIDIIKICRDDNLHTILYITIGVITSLLFISSFKKKNFLEYIGIISITVAISTLLFNGLMSLIKDKTTTSLANINFILQPLSNTFYKISLIGIILGIILLIIQHFINKRINKEVVPF